MRHRASDGALLEMAGWEGKSMTDSRAKAGWLRLWQQFLFAGLLGYWPRLLFLIPLVAVLCLPFYNRIEPTLWGIPFFYWYQLALVIVCALLVMIVYLIETRFRKAPRGDDIDTTPAPGEIL
jgi:hypothetical protein